MTDQAASERVREKGMLELEVGGDRYRVAGLGWVALPLILPSLLLVLLAVFVVLVAMILALPGFALAAVLSPDTSGERHG